MAVATGPWSGSPRDNGTWRLENINLISWKQHLWAPFHSWARLGSKKQDIWICMQNPPPI